MIREGTVIVSEVTPVGVVRYFGTDVDPDDGRPLDSGSDARSGRCYELAALASGAAPKESLLVHGSIHGPEADMIRMGHAWVVLPSGHVWEPLWATVYDKDEWYAYARARDERSYSVPAVWKLLAVTGHYGRWHESRYP